MALYEFTFHFTHADGCLWGANDAAKREYGYFIDINKLPLSDNTKEEIHNLYREYDTRFDWSIMVELWGWRKKHQFRQKTKNLLKVLSDELGENYTIKTDRKSLADAVQASWEEKDQLYSVKP